MTAYPVLGKAKSRDICAAFIEGAPQDAKGSVFYGVDQTNIRHWQRVSRSGEPYWYCDNSFFDKTRGTHFRIGRNCVQHDGQGRSQGERFKALALEIKPWRTEGEHIVICPQSDSFMREVAEYQGDWLSDVVGTIALVSNRSLVVRNWARDKPKLQATLARDLVGAWMLVTYSSAAAIQALLAGIPVSAIGGAARWAGTDPLAIETPFYPEDRERFFGVLADNQFTIDEMRDGTAWNLLNR